MLALNMPMEIWPSQTSNIAILIRAIISQQQNSIFKYLIPLVLNPKVVVRSHEIRFCEIFKLPRRIISEDYEIRFGLSAKLVSFLSSCGLYIPT